VFRGGVNLRKESPDVRSYLRRRSHLVVSVSLACTPLSFRCPGAGHIMRVGCCRANSHDTWPWGRLDPLKKIPLPVHFYLKTTFVLRPHSARSRWLPTIDLAQKAKYLCTVWVLIHTQALGLSLKCTLFFFLAPFQTLTALVVRTLLFFLELSLEVSEESVGEMSSPCEVGC